MVYKVSVKLLNAKYERKISTKNNPLFPAPLKNVELMNQTFDVYCQNCSNPAVWRGVIFANKFAKIFAGPRPWTGFKWGLGWEQTRPKLMLWTHVKMFYFSVVKLFYVLFLFLFFVFLWSYLILILIFFDI